MEEIKAYKCEYCKKYSKNKGVITRHEKECYHRPEMKACATCKFLGQSMIEVTGVLGDGTGYQNIPVCGKGIDITRKHETFGYLANLKHDCPLWDELKEEDKDYCSIKEFCKMNDVDYNPTLDAYISGKAVLMCVERDLCTADILTGSETVKGYPYSVLEDIFNETIS